MGCTHVLDNDLTILNAELERNFNLKLVIYVDKHNVPVSAELVYAT